MTDRPLPCDPSEYTAEEGRAVERAVRRIRDALVDDTRNLMDLFDEMLRLCCVGTERAPFNMRQWAEWAELFGNRKSER